MKQLIYNGEVIGLRPRIWHEPRCRTMADIGVALAAVGVASSIGEYAYSAANQPQAPNLGAASAQMANLQASELPIIDRLQSAAETGGSTLNQGYTSGGDAATVRAGLQSQIAALQKQLAPSGSPLGVFEDTGIQNKISALQKQLSSVPASGAVYYNSKGQIVPEAQAVANFKGYGTADVQSQIMNQEAQGQLANAAQFDPQFIAQAQAEEALANPQGVKARADLYGEIQKQIGANPVSPVATELDRQMSERAAAGSGLTPEEQAMLDKDVNSMGSITGTQGAQPDFSTAMTTGLPGEQRALMNAELPAGYLATGDSPGDVQYRADQQNLQNLSKYISGATPESEFSQLSGASSGATPNYNAGTLPGYNTGAGTQGANAAITNFGERANQFNNTPSPWSIGVSSVLGAGNLAESIAPNYG